MSKPVSGTWSLGSELTSAGRSFLRLHQCMNDLYQIHPFEIVIYEEPLNLGPGAGVTNKDTIFALMGLAAHVDSYCEAKGVRKVRGCCVRNTYPELKSTTIKTWLDWYPMTRMRWDAPITGTVDINLPDGNGFELCKLIKPQHPDTIVIFLTANDQESDQIRGYEVGAVDYITKPFVIGALQRKIKAMFAMLEHHKPAKDIYDDGRLFLDFSEQTASLNGKPLTLSPMEYKMLNLFRKNPRQVLTRGQLLEKLWDIDERFVDEHTLTTSISRIRSKIESDGGAPYIKTVYGMGYQWTGGEAK